MELILRAMVRGRLHSFNTSRSERGPGPALDLLWEVKRLYRGFQTFILSEPGVRTARVATAGAAAALVSSLLLGYSLLSPASDPASKRRSAGPEICDQGPFPVDQRGVPVRTIPSRPSKPPRPATK